jgi:hypothetical protein
LITHEKGYSSTGVRQPPPRFKIREGRAGKKIGKRENVIMTIAGGSRKLSAVAAIKKIILHGLRDGS